MSGEIKWQRVPIVSRLVCGLFGLGGVFIACVLLSNVELLAMQSATTLFNLAMGAVGLLIFLFVAIVGKFPGVSKSEGNDGSK